MPSETIVEVLTRRACIIAGQWVPSAAGTVIDVVNPATGDTLGQVPDAGKELTEQAIDAAASAFPRWSSRPAHHRAEALIRIARRLNNHADDLARLMTLEQGKPLAESKGEVAYAASFFDWFAGEAVRIGGRTIPSSVTDKRILTIAQPVGVCAAITPWNFPLAMLARKAAAALAAGCTMVAKPDEHTPFCGLCLGDIINSCTEPGVMNVITGRPAPIGKSLMADSRVRKVSFTGSTEIGKLLVRQSADTLKRLTLELGGNAPFIVLDDADLDAAVQGAMQSRYRNAGQTCVCANRFLVHESIAELFATRVAAASAQLKVGNGLDDGIQIGPLIDADAVSKVTRLVDDAVSKGARIIGGSRLKSNTLFVQPLVLDRVTSSMSIANEEIFGPVCAIQSFRDENEAVALANSTPFGLAAYLYTSSISRAIQLSESIESGMVGLNTGLISHAQAPFGGIKQSGYGREGGLEGIGEYLNVKYVCVGI